MTERTLAELLGIHARKAQEATAGPWSVGRFGGRDIFDAEGKRVGTAKKRNATHIAANDPSVIAAFVVVAEAIEAMRIEWIIVTQNTGRIDGIEVSCTVCVGRWTAYDLEDIYTSERHSSNCPFTALATLRQQLASKHSEGEAG